MEQNTKPIAELYRSSKNRIIFGVAGGLGEYFEIDPIIFRIIFVALSLGSGWGVLLYLVLSVIIPGKSSGESGKELDLKKRTDELVSELRDRSLSKSRNNWLGWAMIALGIVLLLDQLLPKGFFNWHFLWAIVIIAMGFFVLTRSQAEYKEEKKEDFKQEEDYKGNMGTGRLFFGLMFLMVGIAFLTESLGLIPGFRVNLEYLLRLWPVFLIILGLSFLSQGSRTATFISFIIVFIAIAILTIFIFFPNHNWFQFWNLVSK